MTGPLALSRAQILRDYAALQPRTGDVLYCQRDVTFLGIPFCAWVAKYTRSEYSHAAAVRMTAGLAEVLEIDQHGPRWLTLSEFIDGCTTPRLTIARPRYLSEQMQSAVAVEMQRLHDSQPGYDFTFADPLKPYCTEGTAEVLRRAGYHAFVPEPVTGIVPHWLLPLIVIANGLLAVSRRLLGTTRAAIPLREPVYYVGNPTRGMLASPMMETIYEWR
jgi:hypothetical protein